MGEAAFWGAVGASSLLVGAEVAFAFRLSRMVIGLIMAFGVGALISSVSFELIAPAMESADSWQVPVGLALGSLVFFAGDRAIQKMSASKGDDSGSGLGIVLGTVLDGIPESAVLGMSLVGGGGVSVSLPAGIWISNFPESLSSSVGMQKSWAKSRIRLMWLGIVAVSAVAAALGYGVVENSDTLTGSFVEAFAAGALLTMIVDEMAPESFERSKIFAGLATVAGFAVAVFLTSLEA